MLFKANNLVASHEEFMEMDIEMHLVHLDYLREQGKYPEDMKNWILPKKKSEYLEMVMRAKGLWQDKK